MTLGQNDLSHLLVVNWRKLSVVHYVSYYGDVGIRASGLIPRCSRGHHLRDGGLVDHHMDRNPASHIFPVHADIQLDEQASGIVALDSTMAYSPLCNDDASPSVPLGTRGLGYGADTILSETLSFLQDLCVASNSPSVLLSMVSCSVPLTAARC